MAKYLSNIDLANNQLQNATLHPNSSAPSSPSAGQVYFNTGSSKLFVSDGSNWIDLTGDITGITAGTGLTGGGTNGAVTLNVIGGTGITANADDISITNTAVTAGSYGSATAIPTFTVNAQGQLTAAGTATISTDLTISDAEGTPNTDVVSVGSDTLVFEGIANEITTLVSNNKVTIGLPNDVTIGNDLVVTGDLTVSGTTTTVNSETINLADNIITLNSNFTGSTATENAGIEIERGDETNVALRWNEANNIWQITEDGSTYKKIQVVENSTKAFTIGDGTETDFPLTHSFNTKDVIVQIYDLTNSETVFADVTRNTVNQVTISFASAPASTDMRVLVSKIG
jgi:hypothetical protein